jgi:predicted TIM-barrel fold metal-dependent hydrolase
VILDANCAIGHWPFRRLWTTTADGLLRLLDEAGIERAVVGHTHGVFYRSPHESNAELHDALRLHRDRLIPFACLSPDYAGWRDDLKQCVEEWGMAGLRLYPSYHRYDLAGGAAAELLAEAERLELPVSVPCAFEDPRQRHPLDTVPDLLEHPLAFAARRFPGVRFLYTNVPLTTLDMVARHSPLQENVVFDTCGLAGPLSDALLKALAIVGPRRIVLGTHAPFKYPHVSLLRVRLLDLPDAERDGILGTNAAAFLRV